MSSVRFQSGPAQEYSWVDVGVDAVVYHRPSGKTHFLNAGTALLLREILTEPVDADEAAERLAKWQGATVDARFSAHVAQLLSRLDELGLVHRVDS